MPSELIYSWSNLLPFMTLLLYTCRETFLPLVRKLKTLIQLFDSFFLITLLSIYLRENILIFFSCLNYRKVKNIISIDVYRTYVDVTVIKTGVRICDGERNQIIRWPNKHIDFLSSWLHVSTSVYSHACINNLYASMQIFNKLSVEQKIITAYKRREICIWAWSGKENIG